MTGLEPAAIRFCLHTNQKHPLSNLLYPVAIVEGQLCCFSAFSCPYSLVGKRFQGTPTNSLHRMPTAGLWLAVGKHLVIIHVTKIKGHNIVSNYIMCMQLSLFTTF